MVGGRPWFVYLVGIVHNQKVDEIRLAAVSAQHDTFTWVLSPKSPQSLHMYRNYNEGLGKQRFPGRRAPPVEYSNFPRGEDRFDLTLNGGHVTVVHKASGAWWEISLSG